MSQINALPFAAKFSNGLPARSLTQTSTLPGLASPNAIASSMNETSSAITKFEKSKLDIGLSLIPGTSVNVDSQNSAISPHYPTSCVEMTDSEKWIKKYGLRANKLTYEHILNLIGFKQTQGSLRHILLELKGPYFLELFIFLDYLKQFKKSITSKYGQGLFLQTQSKDGIIYNVSFAFI